MRAKRAIQVLVAISLFVALVIVAVAVYLYIIPDARGKDYPVSISDFRDTGEFTIDPNNIFIDLKNGMNNVLTPVPTSSDAPIQSGGDESSVIWTFSDYLKVTEIVKSQVWKEDMKDWDLYRMYFYGDCNNTLGEFTIGDFVYFKPVVTPDGNQYAAREILINPPYARISWGSGNLYPKHLLNWKKIDLGKIGIGPDDALRIADDLGGKESRLKVNNACSIFLSYNPNVNSDNWILSFTHNNELPSIFKIQIDPYTGKAKVIEQNN
jgi:hypothetical protein